MVHDDQIIKSIILTLKNELVMVPNAAVAEIISVNDVKKIDGSPRWMLGKARWRGVELPVVSYEAAGGDSAQDVNINTQVAVMYTVSDDADKDKTHSYIGLAIHGVPHVNTFSRGQIRSDEHASVEHPMLAQKVRINGAAAGILDIYAIEKMLQQAAI
jgi:chemosensory pili system protein ChpC